MTKAELIVKIDNIKGERDRLGVELLDYERQLASVMHKDEMSKLKNSIGKCYVAINERDIQAFKIISIPEQAGSITFANCIVIANESAGSHDKGNFSIGIKLFGVWCYNKMQMIVTDTTKVIDNYREISQEEFDKILAGKIEKLVEATKV